VTPDQLFPRAPKRKKQPRAEQLREQLALAADEIIRLQRLVRWYERDRAPLAELPPPPAPPPVRVIRQDLPGAGLWRRLLQRIRA
jgi:hypothetical protein